jgi:hypothetical protein
MRYVVEEARGSCARELFYREDDRRRCVSTAAAVSARGGCAYDGFDPEDSCLGSLSPSHLGRL